jgi:hypothetical protein
LNYLIRPEGKDMKDHLAVQDGKAPAAQPQSEARSPALAIWQRRGDIERRQRAEIAAATKDIRARFGAELQALRAECAASAAGHKWRYDHIGILHYIQWFRCAHCHAAKSVDTSEPQAQSASAGQRSENAAGSTEGTAE